MRLILIIWLLCAACSLQASQIVLIIDDMGNKKQDEKAFVLPENVAFAILPNKPLSTSFSERAAAQRREVILHMPMESLSGLHQEKGGLISTMHPKQITQSLQTALATVPHAIGMNNHQGSRFTQLTLPMSITMEFLSKRGLFFIDSRTTRYSKAETIAKQSGVLSAKRNVFLDHVVKYEQIDMQFNRLLRLSKKYGHAVGIAHPYPQTLTYLEAHLSTLEAQGIQLVKVSEIFSPQPSYAFNNRPHTVTPTLKE